MLNILNTGGYQPASPQSFQPYVLDFQQYLQDLPQGFQPSDFVVRATSWDNINAIGAGLGLTAPLPSRRLFFWTMRFFAEQASKGLASARDSVINAFDSLNTSIHSNVDVNWNNVAGQWYMAQKSQGPDVAFARMDWFESGRLKAHTLWTEDWFLDQRAQTWSFIGDSLRSAGMLSPNYGISPPQPGEPGGFGGYIVGEMLAGYNGLGGHPAGATYKILSLIGHGAKSIDIWDYGPFPIGADNWSQMRPVYKPIADAIRLVGCAEKVLFPGRPSRGNVAIYLSGISNLWDSDSANVIYQYELMFLHYALIHSGYAVDFVDDYDLANGALQQRKYRTLYVTGPNVANDKNQNAQDQINSWVEQGGVLAVTPGAGVADEYNTPTTIFDTILGLASPRDLPRDILGISTDDPYHAFDMAYTLTVTDPRLGSGTIDISNPVGSIVQTTATVIASFSNGSNAITLNNYGKGYGIAYAFYPGVHYQQSANWDTTMNEPSQGAKLPYGWEKLQRDLITAPARIVGTPKPITLKQNGNTIEMVESCLLESNKGIAIVLLNWADTPEHVPIKNLTITINNSPDPEIPGNPKPPIIPVGSKISSAQGNVVTPLSITSQTPWHLPFPITLSQLDYADVITIDPQPSPATTMEMANLT